MGIKLPAVFDFLSRTFSWRLAANEFAVFGGGGLIIRFWKFLPFISSCSFGGLTGFNSYGIGLEAGLTGEGWR